MHKMHLAASALKWNIGTSVIDFQTTIAPSGEFSK